MNKGTPDYRDAELVLRAYELRRESVMRASRAAINGRFWPAAYEDLKLVATDTRNELNEAYRQVSTYWEMIYGMVKAGIVNAEYFMESNGEGLFLFARIEPYLEQLRKDTTPFVFRNAEWVATHTDRGKALVEIFRGRVRKMLETRKSA
jgi:hypothetical protein